MQPISRLRYSFKFADFPSQLFLGNALFGLLKNALKLKAAAILDHKSPFCKAKKRDTDSFFWMDKTRNTVNWETMRRKNGCNLPTPISLKCTFSKREKGFTMLLQLLPLVFKGNLTRCCQRFLTFWTHFLLCIIMNQVCACDVCWEGMPLSVLLRS